MLFYEASATDGKKISYPFFSSQKAIFTHLFGKIYMEIEFIFFLNHGKSSFYRYKIFSQQRILADFGYVILWNLCNRW